MTGKRLIAPAAATRRASAAALTFVAASSIAVLALPQVAAAQRSEVVPPWYYRTNIYGQDGLSEREIRARAEAAFPEANGNDDLWIDFDEYLAWQRSLVGLDEMAELTPEAYRDARRNAGPLAPPPYAELAPDGAGVTETGFAEATSRAFLAVDGDDDRALQMQEWEALFLKAYSTLDLDEDGVISLAEAELFAADEDTVALMVVTEEEAEETATEPAPQPDEAAESAFAGLDGDGDGAVTLAEVLRWNAAEFERQDADGNGVITPAEWDLRAQEHFGYRVNPEPLDYQSHSTFAEHDRDGDNAVTLAEWRARIRVEFALLDGNDDGVVDLGELSTHYIDVVPD